MKNHHAISLIEMLLVLAIVAILITLSIRQFQVYRRHMDVAVVKSDINTIKKALAQYYYTTGCKEGGEFASTNMNPSLASLGLDNLTQGHRPIATAYQASIVKLDQKTKKNQPIYQLKIQLILNSDFSEVRRLWYKKALDASSQNSNVLTWKFLPHLATLLQQPDSAQDLALFKQQQNKKLGVTHSSSYCAH